MARSWIAIASVFLLACAACAAEDGGQDISAEVESSEDFNAEEWTTYYYLDPGPELTYNAVRQLHNDGFLTRRNARAPLVAFFSIIFRENPSLLPSFISETSGLDEAAMQVLAEALWHARTDEANALLETLAEKTESIKPLTKREPPDILEGKARTAADLDRSWAAFCATGKTEYLDRVVNCLAYRDSEELAETLLFGAARWSLKSNCQQHDKVREYCTAEAQKREGAVRDALEKILAEIEAAPSPPAPVGG